ncbi:hypothetical protein WR25_01638 [Diploscapter pachys]|uniref:Beta-lactamase-related domain-containing protein n=1 Tax=Diploscapter pachys TaxID=2018661 RepID=A0A2A2JSA1_9BILA|nr:hypothetical protein WR25_01638 [Diploscapter pachys]
MQYPYSRPSTSHSPTSSIRQVAGYKIIYLGKKKVYFNPKRYNAPNEELGKSNEEKVVDQIENAQLSGELLQDIGQEPEQWLTLSKYGIQMTNVSNGIVCLRIPLFSFVFTVVFEDSSLKSVENSIMISRKRSLALVECPRHRDQHECHLLQFIDKKQPEEFSNELERILLEAKKDSDKLLKEAEQLKDEKEEEEGENTPIGSEDDISSGYESARLMPGWRWASSKSLFAATAAFVSTPVIYGKLQGNESEQQEQEKISIISKVQRQDNLVEKIAKARTVVDRYMTIYGIPGLSVAVSVDGKKIYAEGFGYADVEIGAKCTEDTVMRIASISKPFTATIAAKLFEAGKLDLDKDILVFF